jgi:hypothetical protein
MAFFRKNIRRNFRTKEGSLLAEVAVGSLFLSVFAALSCYAALLLLGISVNDRACRDAARAAAQGQSAAASTKLATAILKAHSSRASFLGSPILSNLIYNNYSDNQTSPIVQVTTTLTATVPFKPISFFSDAAFMAHDQQLVFSQTYTFPIVKTP